MNKWHKFEFRPNDAVWKLDKMFLSYESEKGYSYGFIEISVGIYRTSTPESVQRNIVDMKADGIYDRSYVDDE